MTESGIGTASPPKDQVLISKLQANLLNLIIYLIPGQLEITKQFNNFK